MNTSVNMFWNIGNSSESNLKFEEQLKRYKVEDIVAAGFESYSVYRLGLIHVLALRLFLGSLHT